LDPGNQAFPDGAYRPPDIKWNQEMKEVEKMAEKCVCTVCEIPVEMEKAPFKVDYKEKVYNFCSSKCQKAFEAKPDEYCTRWSGKVPG
jgi:YHS domain-containing protein